MRRESQDCLAVRFGLATAFGVAQIDVHQEGSCLFIRVVGRLTSAEVIAVAREYYPRYSSANRIWDMMEADMRDLDEESLASISKTVREYNDSAAFIRTAFVTAHFPSYALLSRYLLHAFKSQVRAEYKVFSEVEAAWEWIHAK